MSHLSVGVVFTSQEWRPAFQRYVRDHAVGVSLRVIRDSRMALEEHVDVLVVDDETSFLGPQFVAAVRERGGRTVGVYDPAVADDGGHSVLARMGVDCLVPCTVSPEELWPKSKTSAATTPATSSRRWSRAWESTMVPKRKARRSSL